jgi:hypothetical protein
LFASSASFAPLPPWEISRAIHYADARPAGAIPEAVGVREIAHLEASENLDELDALLHRAIEDAEMDALRQPLASVAAILVGKVIETRSASEPGHVPFSEHDPDWSIATTM